MARPLIFKTAEELEAAINGYMATDKPTLAGLAYHLGIDRQTLYNYADRDEFFDTIKRARDYVESKYEERLIYENSPTGVIFALKNMGWKDKSEIENSGNMGLIWNETVTYAPDAKADNSI
jgi:hypothetical protein